MAQLFSRRATLAFRLSLAALVAALGGGLALGVAYVRTEAFWNVGRPAEQPIPFRHDLHAGTLAVDCRYCHTAVERSARAGMPSATTCMSCHSRVWQAASMLEPIRTSVALSQPIRWSSVHRLPSHAYFHHGAHVSTGLACATCHGDVSTMARTVKAETLSMGWCLQCHRDTAEAQASNPGAGARGPLRSDPVGAAPLLTNCSTCHR